MEFSIKWKQILIFSGDNETKIQNNSFHVNNSEFDKSDLYQNY